MINLNPKDWLLLLFVVVSLGLIGGIAYKEYRYNELEAEYAAYRAEQSEAYAEAQRLATEKLQAQLRAKEEIEVSYARGIRSTSANLDRALKRVREYEAQSGPRKPAEAAPAECGTYDASPAQLSGADREFLVRLGTEADSLAFKVNSLQDYIREITK